ncbi:MAG: MBL fold metallo-hydrolase [Planctomycetota bacterium]
MNANLHKSAPVFLFVLIASWLGVVSRLEAGGDADGDGDIDITEIAALLACLDGPELLVGPTCQGADFDGDGDVDLVDFAELQRRFTGDGPVPGTLAVSWIHGSPSCASDSNPPIQVHAYNDDTFILRQNKCIHYEAPFIYLLFGEEKVFMQDTGATSSLATFPLRTVVQGIIAQWLSDHGLSSIELIVTHSHGHGDHVAADGQFSGQPLTTVVGTSQTAVRNFFGITSWPDQIVSFDLGGRVVDIIPIPGHHSSHIAVYDRRTDLLLTGDTLYPGRLYISSWTSYQASIARLVAFCATHDVSHILGTHIEMSATPGVDYPIGTTYQPNEHVLELDLSHLLELNAAVIAMGTTPVYQVHDAFIIFP